MTLSMDQIFKFPAHTFPLGKGVLGVSVCLGGVHRLLCLYLTLLVTVYIWAATAVGQLGLASGSSVSVCTLSPDTCVWFNGGFSAQLLC